MAASSFVIRHSSFWAHRLHRPRSMSRSLLVWLCAMASLSPRAGTPQDAPKPAPPRYEWHADHSPDGTGRFYMGREITQVMGHQWAQWLERPQREAEEQPAMLIERLQLKPGDTVADIGAGTGYFTRRLARKVGPAGKVFAVDIQQEMLDLLQTSMAALRITNVVPVLGTTRSPNSPRPRWT